jgi:hypothetical protein
MHSRCLSAAGLSLNNLYPVSIFCTSTDFQLYKLAYRGNLAMKETVTCWIRKDTHNRLKVFCALYRLSMMQFITQAVKEWLEQQGSNLGDEALQVLQRGKPHDSVIDVIPWSHHPLPAFDLLSLISSA